MIIMLLPKLELLLFAVAYGPLLRLVAACFTGVCMAAQTFMHLAYLFHFVGYICRGLVT